MNIDVILNIKKTAKENFIPIVRDNTLNAILELIKKIKPKKILEIGTAVGYSALNMLSQCDGNIVTIEKNPERVSEAKNNFKEAKVENRVKLIEGDAFQALEGLVEHGEKFEFVFLDGPKGQYIKYLPFILELLNEKGVLFADNVGLLGLVADKEKVNHKNRTMVRNMQTFLDTVTKDINLKVQIYDEDDGYAIIEKKSKNDRNS